MKELKDVELKENEVLEVGYFSNAGFEHTVHGECQVLSGVAFEDLKEDNPTLKVAKTDEGYASELIMKRKYGLKNGI